MVPDIIRDSTFGQLVNYFSKGKLLPYEDQRQGYVLPARYQAALDGSSKDSRNMSITSTMNESSTPQTPAETLVAAEGVCDLKGSSADSTKAADIEKQGQTDSASLKPQSPQDPFLIDWEENDQDHPRNWSFVKRCFVATLISLLTFSVYVGSAIYTSSIPGIMAQFGVSQVVAILGLSLFVLAYGVSPMFLAPLQEMPKVGRTPVYIIGLGLFAIFQFPIIWAPNIGTILVFRFFSGFVGAPALATGGASMLDIFPMEHAAIAIGVWAIGAVCGPVTGPVIGGFAAQAKSWAWPNLELLWISGFAFFVLFFCLPETFEPTVLVRRAERIRKLTGDNRFRAQAEIDAVQGETFAQLLWVNFKRAFQLAAEPAVLFANSYIALVYAIFYLWFEAFPIVYNDIYRFSLGIGGLPYLAFVVSGVITFTFYVIYQIKYINPKMAREGASFLPETRLELGLLAGCFIPISLLIFGWSARSSVHWIVPTIGAGLYLPGIFLLFQCILMYISMIYPPHLAASILAGNDLFRSSFASAFPLFGHQYYNALGLGPGCTMLAGVSVLMIPLMYALIKFGPRLRAQSKWAQ